jgi:hypothetical protein
MPKTPQWTETQMQMVLINPFYAIQIDPMLAMEHPPLVSKTQWIEANLQLMKDMGEEQWLRLLLNTLETGGLKSEG